MISRTPQGSIAWAISLVAFPFVSVPIYFIFGARKFYGYIEARREGTHAIARIGEGVKALLKKHQVDQNGSEILTELKNLAMLPALTGNKIKLLKDGRATFNVIIDKIDNAKSVVLVQFYIVRDDDLGNEIKQSLITKAKQGVDVYFLYDEIGSYSLSQSYIDELKNSGVQILPFSTTLGSKARRFQINFRNHRKIVIVDGEVAYVGGHNIGDEYLGRNPLRGAWRDTHLQLEGPIVKAIQLSFLEDWHWVCDKIPNLPWEEVSSPGGVQCLCVPSGPSDLVETCELLFISLINNAKKRIWITSPYFVLDKSIVSALTLAVLRGVDVRVLLPEKFDSRLIQFASESYIEECLKYGVKIYRYTPAFMHQKVVLVDEDKTVIGTANFDNRSFHLNFEISIFSISHRFTAEVEEMLSEDFMHSYEMKPIDFDNTPFYKRFLYRLASLFSPVL